MSTSRLPSFPVTCLKTANEMTTDEAFQGQNTVVDFWTTKCTRCPAALDKLNAMAQDPKYAGVKFVSICCDKLDGAREIMEQENEPKWNSMNHYFMDHEHKEQAKKLLGFKAVPFYVVLNQRGEMTQKGSSKQVDFDKIPGMVHSKEDVAQVEKENVVQVVQEKVVEKAHVASPKAVADSERVFTLDEDF